MCHITSEASLLLRANPSIKTLVCKSRECVSCPSVQPTGLMWSTAAVTLKVKSGLLQDDRRETPETSVPLLITPAAKSILVNVTALVWTLLSRLAVCLRWKRPLEARYSSTQERMTGDQRIRAGVKTPPEMITDAECWSEAYTHNSVCYLKYI